MFYLTKQNYKDIFGDFFGAAFPNISRNSNVTKKYDNGKVIYNLLVAGIALDDIKATIKDNILKVDAKNNSYSYNYQITITEDVDLGDVDVNVSNGIMSITFKEMRSQEPEEKVLQIK